MHSKFDERLVATSLPTDGQLRVIFAVVGVLVVALVATAPYALKTTYGTEIFLPAYAAAIFVVEVTTATILLATFRVRGSVHLLILASGYLLSGMLSLPWALTFPGVFTTLGLDHNLQSTAWLAALRRIGFASAVVGYALIGRNWVVRSPSSWARGCVAMLTAFVTFVVWMTMSGAQGFPRFMLDARHVGPAWRYVPIAGFVLYGIGMIALVIRRQSTLDIWICVVLFSLGVETFLLSHMGGAVRLSVGWWSGRLFGLIVAGSILLVLLSETTENDMRLARAAANDRRARANRFMAMEALSASIAHEINQPLSSMVNNANAGLRWLSRDDLRARLRWPSASNVHVSRATWPRTPTLPPSPGSLSP